MSDQNDNKFESDRANQDQRAEAYFENMRSLKVPELSFSKLVFLCVLALLFASLEPFALFASIPFTLSFLLYGKGKTFILGAIGTALAIVLMKVQVFQGSAVGTFPMALIYGYLISQTIKKRVHPVTGILRNGFTMFLLVMAGVLLFNYLQPGGIEGVITPNIKEAATQYYNTLKEVPNAPAEQLRQLEDLKNDPSTVVSSILNYGTSAIFIGVFLSIWVGTFVVLKLGPLWRVSHNYPYNVKSLTSFKVPFTFVWPLIGGLILAVGNVYGQLGDWAEVVGFNILLMLGIFYFFQGFGILSDLLNKWRIFGFFRTMVIFFSVIMGYQVLALVGVLDTWVDFRRLFKSNNNDEGDKL